jgi:hypothetical protein
MERTISLEVSKRGTPCTWECGGGWSNTGSADIICAADGSPKAPIYVRRKGELACGNHTLIPVQVGDVLVEAEHHRKDFTISISEVVDIVIEENGYIAKLHPLAKFDNGEWDDIEKPKNYKGAINAAIDKSTCYHCREPHYIKEANGN